VFALLRNQLLPRMIGHCSAEPARLASGLAGLQLWLDRTLEVVSTTRADMIDQLHADGRKRVRQALLRSDRYLRSRLPSTSSPLLMRWYSVARSA
jgi:hypothetical protein